MTSKSVVFLFDEFAVGRKARSTTKEDTLQVTLNCLFLFLFVSVLQKFYRTIEALALDRDEVEEVKDTTSKNHFQSLMSPVAMNTLFVLEFAQYYFSRTPLVREIKTERKFVLLCEFKYVHVQKEN